MRDLPLPPRRHALLIVPPMNVGGYATLMRVLLLSEAFNLYIVMLRFYGAGCLVFPMCRRMLCAPSLCRLWLIGGVVGPGRGRYARSLDQRPLLRRSCREPGSGNPPHIYIIFYHHQSLGRVVGSVQSYAIKTMIMYVK